MNVGTRNLGQVRQQTAAVLAFVFVVFALLVPALHKHGDWVAGQSAPAASGVRSAPAAHAVEQAVSNPGKICNTDD